jgi:hypothetical protein
VLVEVAVANAWFLMHASRPSAEAPIEVTAQLALGRGSCRGVVEAA